MTSGLIDDTALAHPLVGFVDDLESLLDQAGTANAWTMTPSELAAVLPRLTRAKARLAELELRTLVEADRASVGDESEFTSTPLWWAHATGQTKPAATGALKLAQALDDGHEPTRTALAAGALLPDQARVIIDAVQALPTSLVEPAVVTSAEKHLVELAAHHDSRALRILGRRILDVIAPEVAEEHERRVLEAEEAHAAATAFFTLRPDGHGSMVGRFKIPTLAGEILAKHLNAIAAPKHQAARVPTRRQAQDDARSTTADTADTGTEDDASSSTVSRPLRLGAAFTEYLETRGAQGLPRAGGIAATVVVTMSMADLLGANSPATLDTGETISASEARRLACEAGIIPAVLGGRSQPLDVGRKRRFHTEPQRIALILRDRGCAAEHCDWPPGMCHAHHLDPWGRGGDTSVGNGILLCPRHHTLAHDSRYQLKAGKNGRVTFSRRT